jgi:streptogramin lyase
VRAYAKQIADVTSTDPAAVRKESWIAMVKYMNYLSAEEFGRGASSAPPDANRVYGVGDGDEISGILYNHFTGSMQQLGSYDYGAPLAVTPDTAIMEYEVPRPNAIREALLGGSPPKLWAADVSSNRVYAIDVATGAQEIHEVPSDLAVGPHTMHRGPDGTIWIAPFFSSVIAQLDPVKKSWRTWPMKNRQGKPVGIHDLSFGYEHVLLTDEHGLVWFSDIGNNAVGYLDPKTGVIENYVAPEITGRPGRQAALYGLVMTKDRKHIWYSQFGIGSFGSFNVETRKFETSVQLPSIHSGPRRLSIDDQDILYVPLYGSGQLIEYDTKAGKQIGIYDLPDRASAPYAVTWDPKRRVVWIPTSNGDVIYKFDPKDKSFSVLPLPRPGAFLRMLVVDPESGVLITSYANIVEHSPGPRMALMIDPGDGAYRRSTANASLTTTAGN